MIPEMLDQSQEINEKIVGHYWTTPEFKTLMNLKGSLPSDEQNIEGLFNAVSSKRFFKGKIGQYGPKSLLDFLTSYLAELVGERGGMHIPYRSTEVSQSGTWGRAVWPSSRSTTISSGSSYWT